MDKKKVAVIGATGFTGSELLRILRHHPYVDIRYITSESRASESITKIHPFLTEQFDSKLLAIGDIDYNTIDLIFMALPHGISMKYIKDIIKYNIPIIDLSADFRLKDAVTYEEWYNQAHEYIEGFDRAVYGLTELYDEKIRDAQLIANPGCYPSSVILALAPLLKKDLIDTSSLIIIDSKSGVTGGGALAKPINHFSSVNDNFRAYGLKNHRHTVEIEEKLNEISDSSNIKVQFTPHLLPVDRGILSTIYVKPKRLNLSDNELNQIYTDFYGKNRFIRVMNQSPSIKNVRGSNYCDIYATYDARTENLIVICAIDNLVKGAAGQAVQNMNVLFHWDESVGLNHIPLSP